MDGVTLEFKRLWTDRGRRVLRRIFLGGCAFEAAGIDGDSEDLSLMGRVMTIERGSILQDIPSGKPCQRGRGDRDICRGQ